MGSNAKRRTTFAKISREQKLAERRMEKQSRKDRKEKEGNTPPPAFSEAPPPPAKEPIDFGKAEV